MSTACTCTYRLIDGKQEHVYTAADCPDHPRRRIWNLRTAQTQARRLNLN